MRCATAAKRCALRYCCPICFHTLVVGSRVEQGWVAILAALFFLVPIVLEPHRHSDGLLRVTVFDRIHRGIAAFAMTIYYLVLGIISAVTYFSNNLPPTDPAFVILLGNSIAFLGFLLYDIARLSMRGVTPDDDDD